MQIDEEKRLSKHEEDQVLLQIVKLFKTIEKQAELKNEPTETFHRLEIMINEILPVVYHKTRANAASRFKRKVSNICNAEKTPELTDEFKDKKVAQYFKLENAENMTKTKSTLNLRRMMTSHADD